MLEFNTSNFHSLCTDMTAQLGLSPFHPAGMDFTIFQHIWLGIPKKVHSSKFKSMEKPCVQLLETCPNQIMVITVTCLAVPLD